VKESPTFDPELLLDAAGEKSLYSHYRRGEHAVKRELGA
jgi:hypothetical protein